MRYRLITRQVDGWRATTYQREDGSIFHVAVPPVDVMQDDSQGRRRYLGRTFDEASEHEMALRLGLRTDV